VAKGGKAYLVKSHKGRERITPLATKQGQINKQEKTFFNDGMVDMEKQMETMCFHLLIGPAFGDQNPPNGEVWFELDLKQTWMVYDSG